MNILQHRNEKRREKWQCELLSLLITLFCCYPSAVLAEPVVPLSGSLYIGTDDSWPNRTLPLLAAESVVEATCNPESGWMIHSAALHFFDQEPSPGGVTTNLHFRIEVSGSNGALSGRFKMNRSVTGPLGNTQPFDSFNIPTHGSATAEGWLGIETLITKNNVLAHNTLVHRWNSILPPCGEDTPEPGPLQVR